MRPLTEGRKMFISVMTIFVIYAIIFIVFEDYDRLYIPPFEETSDWHLLIFSLVVMAILSWVLHRYSQRMDHRISREQADKENLMRRELTQNIAHELKTPVSSILGYAETLLEHPEIDEATRRQFVERTRSQAQRLTALLQDISTLNRMDYAADVLTRETVDVSQLVDEIVLETELAVVGRGMTLHNTLPQGIVIQGNTSLVYSIFSNLVDNAIKYAGQGKEISISATDEGDRWHFTLSDNGAGIGTEHLTRIFERFYRIDKSRSRSLGGTGLGLAIVKNAVQLHGGTIKAQSSPGKGLSYDFTLSKK